ncbi:hypothetical protein PAHAL_2G475100 [Panicum hallii]|uniref:Ternary complex factor MIP1 leucine-zipper domain-containing protein n=1 Tax=Panicum hallii TaxID=206008 RepID=A0A2T8KT66_9POAL|nr:hypothetical protein PAHAL_2G475100 [Panicum hallii]
MRVQQSLNEKEPSNPVSSHETPLSMGEILLSLDAGIPLPSPGAEYPKDRHSNKPNGTQQHVKRSNLWGRNNARKGQQSELIDPSGEEELAIQRLEVTKNDLQIRIAKEARGNAILQASLERRKQALHERRVALEQDVSRLQEQLQAERDLRAALEVGLSMSSSQLSSSRSMDSKTRAELEEIALAEADVARLKQKVAELHLQLNQQRQHQYGSSVDANDRYQHLPSHISLRILSNQDLTGALLSVIKRRSKGMRRACQVHPTGEASSSMCCRMVLQGLSPASIPWMPP